MKASKFSIDNIDRRIVYIFVALALSIPLLLKVELPPAKMDTAQSAFSVIDKLAPEKGIVLISADWGPNTYGENEPQTRAAIEHLMRRRIPIALITIYSLATPYLDQIPRAVAKDLEAEFPGQRWEYGKDWVNLGFRIQPAVMIQGLAKTKDIADYFKTDAYGTSLASLPAMQGIKSIEDISLFVETTGLSGILSLWIGYLQGATYRPPFIHGCTSISIPDSYNYFASGQLVGLFEGIAGAAWYDKLLTDTYPKRSDQTTQLINSSLAFAHLIIIALIILGNVSYFLKKKERK